MPILLIAVGMILLSTSKTKGLLMPSTNDYDESGMPPFQNPFAIAPLLVKGNKTACKYEGAQ